MPITERKETYNTAFSMSPHMHDRLEQVSVLEGDASISSIIRKAVQEYLDAHYPEEVSS
jgi:predicted DNA-binding protein